jgi:hypothetical protein
LNFLSDIKFFSKEVAGLFKGLDLKDIGIHAGVAMILAAIAIMMPDGLYKAVSLVVFWYSWELSQRVAKDDEKRGLLYWWNVLRWSAQAKMEFIVPAVVSVIVFVPPI